MTINKTKKEDGLTINPKQLKTVSPWTSLSSFPSNIHVDGQNPDEYLLLFIRQHKIILVGDLLLYTVILFFPQFIRLIINYFDYDLLNGMIGSNSFFSSKWWMVLNLAWFSFILTGYFNAFFKWFYNINILTTERFLDIDYVSIFTNRVESASLKDIQDIKEEQSGVIQNIFNIGNLTLLTASGGTVFSLNNVPKVHKIRDFIMDVVLQIKDKKGGKDD